MRIERVESEMLQLRQMVKLVCRDHERQTKAARIVIPEFLPAIEPYQDVIMLLFGPSGIDMNKFARHPQMNHPNQVTVKTNQDIFRSSFNPEG